MELQSYSYPAEALYPMVQKQLAAMTEGVTDTVSNLANAAALLNLALKNINWVGFYLRKGGSLILGPFQGKPACVQIPWGKGVCGTAAESGQVQRVEDVHAFPGHIACDCDSHSEIVLPLYKDGVVAAVLDIDSPLPGRFTPEDEEGLSLLVPILEGLL